MKKTHLPFLFLVFLFLFLLTSCKKDGIKDNGDTDKKDQYALSFSLTEDKESYICTGLSDAGGKVTLKELNVSSEYNGKPVIGIGDDAFANSLALERVVLPSSVEQIGKNAFKNCSLLTEINIDKVKTVSDSAFFGCAFAPENGVTYIGKWAVYVSSGITNIKFKEGTENISDDESFLDVSDMEFPVSIKHISSSIFRNSKLKTIRFENLESFLSVERCDGSSRGGSLMALYISGSLVTDLLIPQDVISIPAYSFSNISLQTVRVSESVKTVGEGAFSNCGLIREYTAEGSAEYLSDVFSGTEISYVIIDSFEKYLGCSFATSDSNPTVPRAQQKETITLTFGGETVADGAEFVCPVDAVSIPNYAFFLWQNNISLSLNEGLKEIGRYAFAYSDIIISGGREIVIPESVEKIGNGAFEGSEFRAVVIGNGVKVISEDMFADSSVEKITIGTGAETIEAGVFKNCEQLKILSILSDVKTVEDTLGKEHISESVFSGTENITELTVPHAVLKYIPKYSLLKLDLRYLGAKIVRDDFYSTNKNAEITLIIDVKGLCEIEYNSFADKCKFKDLYIANIDSWVGVDLSSVEDSLLYRADNIYVGGELISEIHIGSGVKEIKPYTLFTLNTGIKAQINKIFIPASVAKIGENSISSLKALEVFIVNREEDIEVHPNFQGPYTASGYQNKIFFDNTGVYGENEEYKWYLRGDGKYVLFEYLGSEENIVISDIDGVLIGLVKDGTFDSCSNIVSIKITDSDIRIEDGAFGSSKNFSESFDGTVTQARAITFDYICSVKLSNDGTDASGLFASHLSLCDVTLSGFTKIPFGMFEGCISLNEIKGCENVTEIGDFAFKNSGFDTYCFPKVLTVGEEAFYGTDFTSLELPENTVLGKDAFENIASLKEVVCSTDAATEIDLSDVVEITFVSGNAVAPCLFKNNTKISKVTFNSDLYEIGASAFENCSSISSIEIPESVRVVREKAFSGISVTMLVLPDTVEYAEEDAFACLGKKTLVLCRTLSHPVGWSADFSGKALALFGYTGKVETEGDIVYTVTADSAIIIDLKDKSITSLTVPVSLGGKKVEHIFSSVFVDTVPISELIIEGDTEIKTDYWNAGHLRGLVYLKTLTCFPGNAPIIVNNLPVSLDTLVLCGEGVYGGTGGEQFSVKNLILQDTYSKVLKDSFDGVIGLKTLYIPKSVTEYSRLSSGDLISTLEDLTLPYIYQESRLAELFASPEYTSKIKNVKILSGSMLADYFAGANISSLETYTAGKDVISISFEQFRNTPLKAFIVEEGNATYRNLGNSVLRDGNLIYTPDGVPMSGFTTVGYGACTGPDVSELVLPEGVIKIWEGSFEEHSNLKKVILPSTLKEADNAFETCVNLKTMVVKTGYKTNINFKYADTLIITAEVISDNAFEDSANVKKIDISEVETVGYYAFSGCTSLAEVVMGDKPKTLAHRAFYNCSSLSELDLTNVISIDGRVFEGTKIKSVNFGNKLESIGQNAFKGLSVSELVLPASLKKIDESAFFGITGISTIKFEGSVSEWENIEFGGLIIDTPVEYMFLGVKLESYKAGGESVPAGIFSYCKSLKSVDLSGVSEVGAFAFSGCTELKDIIFGNSIKKIGEQSFSYCQSLTEVNLPEGLTDIGTRALANCGIKNIYVPKTVTFIDKDAFSANPFEEIIMLATDSTKYSGLWFRGFEAPKITVDVNAMPLILNIWLMDCEKVCELTVEGEGILDCDYAFQGMPNLKTLIFKEGVSGIDVGYGAFNNLPKLEDIYIYAEEFSFNSDNIIFRNNSTKKYLWEDGENENLKLHCKPNFEAKNIKYGANVTKAFNDPLVMPRVIITE